MFLVTNKNMGLCLFMNDPFGMKPKMKRELVILDFLLFKCCIKTTNKAITLDKNTWQEAGNLAFSVVAA